MGNLLLRLMPESGLGLLEPLLVAVNLPVNTVLAEAGERIRQHFFLDGGLASAVARSGDGQSIEAAHLGREAVTGHQALLMVETCPYDIYMQVDGTGWQISAQALREVLAQDAGTRQLLLRFVHAL